MEIKEVAQMLKELGYNPADIDGSIAGDNECSERLKASLLKTLMAKKEIYRQGKLQ